jgi:hypothetical protein
MDVDLPSSRRATQPAEMEATVPLWKVNFGPAQSGLFAQRWPLSRLAVNKAYAARLQIYLVGVQTARVWVRGSTEPAAHLSTRTPKSLGSTQSEERAQKRSPAEAGPLSEEGGCEKLAVSCNATQGA